MFDKIDPEIRIALMQASGVSRELHHDSIGPEHLLLGLLSNVRGSAFRVLTAHGVAFEDAKDALVTARADRPGDSEDEASSSLDDDRDALRAIGIDLDKVRDAVRNAFGDDITRDWGERRHRRGGPHGRGRGPHGRPGFGPEGGPWGGRGRPFDEDGPWGEGGLNIFDALDFGPRGGRGRRGPHSRRFGPRHLSPRMHPVWEQVRDSLREGAPFSGLQLLHALLQSGDPVVDAMLATADDADALRAEVARQAAAARPEAG